jgi:hypothetical protein
MNKQEQKPIGAIEAVKNQLKQNRQGIPERLGTYDTNWNTPLSKGEEEQYLKYKKALGDRGDDTYYDLRGYWLKYGRNEDLKNPQAHFTDEFKKPSYATFSKDSYYHNSINPDGTLNVGGEWIGDEEFIPSAEMWGNPQKKKSLLEHQGREEVEKIYTGKGFKITPPSSEPIGAIDRAQMMMRQYGIK